MLYIFWVFVFLVVLLEVLSLYTHTTKFYYIPLSNCQRWFFHENYLYKPWKLWVFLLIACNLRVSLLVSYLGIHLLLTGTSSLSNFIPSVVMSNPRSANIRASASRTPSTNPGPDTVLKKKYGPLPGRPNDRHSGLSPILPFISSAGVARSDAQALRREQKQMSMFYNFTAKELLDLDANITSTRSLKPSDLNFPVHPCFRKSHWFRKGPRHEPHSLGNLGSGGLWLVSEDCVWDILQPSLRLASLCLNNIQPEFVIPLTPPWNCQ